MTQNTPAWDRIASKADEFFHENGTENVSMREILRASEQGNMSAINYHFGGREGLMLAVFRRRREALGKDRGAYLDKIEAEGRGGEIRALVEASVTPLVNHVRDSPRNSDYARFAARMTPRVDFGSRGMDEMTAADRRVLSGLRQSLSHLPAEVVSDRLDTAFSMILGVLCTYEVRREEGLIRGPDTVDALGETLIDMVTAGLTA